ncbi:uncharacterized protein LOC142364931 isoform X7 [Opisthocomus hoazin]
MLAVLCQAVVGLWRVFLNGNKTSGFVKPLLSIWVTCLILLVQMKRDEPIVTEERRAEHCKKVRSNERSRVSAPEVTQTGWYPSISVATCKWQRQGRCRTQPQRGKATC